MNSRPARGDGAQLFPVPPVARDIVLLLARVLCGAILMAHGWQKFSTNGLDATAATFAKSGVPVPHLSAAVAAGVELFGGALLLVGLLTPVVGAVLVVNMLGAWWFVHRGHGVFVTNHGWELVALIGASAALLAVTGPGRFSLDRLLTARRSR